MDSKTETVSDREIAKFMNINLTLGFDVFWVVDEEGEMPDYVNGTVYSPSTNWNQLMAVVEKIANTGCMVQIQIDPGFKDVASCMIAKRTKMISFKGGNLLEVTYKAVVEFIHWYNLVLNPTTEP